MKIAQRVKWMLISVLLGIWGLSSIAFSQQTPPEWTEAKSINLPFKAISSQPDMDVFSAPKTIKVKIYKNTEVRIFTILGKLVSKQLLEPGTYEHKLDVPGIYIIQSEQTSCKVAI